MKCCCFNLTLVPFVVAAETVWTAGPTMRIVSVRTVVAGADPPSADRSQNRSPPDLNTSARKLTL